MAEAAVGYAIDYLTPLLTQESELLRNIHSEVSGIKGDLESIKSFLKDADMKTETEGDNVRDGVKDWVKQLTLVSFHMEDVVDEYIFHLAQHHPRGGGFMGCLYKLGRCIITLKARHQIASQIQDIKLTVTQVIERREKYGFDSISICGEYGSSSAAAAATSWYDPRKRSLYLEEDEVVGIESPKAELIGWLLDEQRTQRTVIMVVGMGGLGKTTLANKVLDSVKEKLDCHAWITVSQSYQKVELLKNIIKKFCEGRKEPAPEGIDHIFDEEKLTNMLREYLRQKRYVVIFDDVWKVDFLGGIQDALLDNKNGSRLVITTRKMEVADFCRMVTPFVHVHDLRPLPLEKALELFCNMVFKFDVEHRCPTYLEELSHKIVKKCEGLPLAVVAIAGLLRTKNKTC